MSIILVYIKQRFKKTIIMAKQTITRIVSITIMMIKISLSLTPKPYPIKAAIITITSSKPIIQKNQPLQTFLLSPSMKHLQLYSTLHLNSYRIVYPQWGHFIPDISGSERTLDSFPWTYFKRHLWWYWREHRHGFISLSPRWHIVHLFAKEHSLSKITVFFW